MTTRRLLLAMTAAAALTPAAVLAATPAPAISAEEQALVDKAVAYLQGLGEAKGRFTQTDPRGAVTTGELFLKRPGKARFAYDPPAGLLVVSDGGRVIVSDSRLNTFTAYPLGATPLSLFLAKTIRLDKGVQVTRVTRAADGFSITARDGKRETAGQIMLSFKDNPMSLVAWAVTDAQGHTTQVRINGLQATSGLDPALFVLRDPRPKPATQG
ncbi:outer membrane lipoprotein carrier protein LolA [Phenylobacterium sp.]|jgi:outer membrane lipoprotein-sorting protein|uniref:LolA family protein n=1 Tax=Phenylobacterium sp. TaxID=1871053 RepID=UPI002E351B2C|nr:outer membrane lipoprotein carrier protein LolA [Phenylobacterium sp.]HEX3366299.1 outer membrane lipoprotein carrier protein LolA [Phenylobacterium sp.]